MTGEIFSVESFVRTCLWQSIVLIVVGLAASFFLRRRSSRAHQILLLSIVAAVIVPVISALVKHYELGVFVAESVVVQSQLEDQTVAGDYSSFGPVAEDFVYEPGPIEAGPPPVTTRSQSTPIPWARIVLYGWIAASLILSIRLLVTFVLGVRLLGRAEPLDCTKMKEAVRSARAKLGIDREVQVCSSRGVRSPVIWCWKHIPVLLVPGADGRCDSAIDWTGVLCHELAHWKRRDHIGGLLAELAVCVLPWHLLLWWAKSRLISLSEQACDDWVLATGQPGADYAESLLDLTPGRQLAFVPTVVSSKKRLPDRVRRILKESCGNPRTGARWALAVSIAAVCIVVGISFAQTRPAEPAGADDPSSRAKLNQILDAMLYHDKAAMPVAMHVEIKMYDLRKPADSAHRQTYSFEQRLDGRRLDSAMTVYRFEDGKRRRTQENRRVFTGSQYLYRQQGSGSLHVGLEPVDKARRVMAHYHLWGGVLLGYLNGDFKPVAAILKDSPAVALQNQMEAVGDSLCYVIEGKTDHGVYKIWVDPERDYRIRRSVVDKGPGDMWFGKPMPKDPPEDGSAVAAEHMEISDVKLERIGGHFIPTAETMTSTMIRTDGSKYLDRMAVTRSQIDRNPDFEKLGAFVMDGVPDGTRVANFDPQSYAYEYEFRDGKVVPVGDGGTIRGRLELTGGRGLDTVLADNKFRFDASIQPMPDTKNKTERRQQHSTRLYPTEDGSFRIENVPTGRRVLNVRLTMHTIKDMPSGSRRPYFVEIADVDREFSIQEKADGAEHGSLDLGVLKTAVSKPGSLNEPANPNEPMVRVDFKNAEFKTIVRKLAAWTGKVIIPAAEALKQKVTIYAPKKLPKDEAVALILNGLRVKGCIVEETAKSIFILPAPKEDPGETSTESNESPLEGLDKNKVVQRFHRLQHCSPTMVSQIVRPLLSDFGHQSVDEKTNTLMIIDAVERLIRIEKVVAELDAPEAGRFVTETFELRHGDPLKIVQTLSRLGKWTVDDMPTAAVIGPRGRPVLFIPELGRKSIIAKAPAEDMKWIRRSMRDLDRPDTGPKEYETVMLGHTNAREVVDRINDVLRQLPGKELQQSVLLQPLEQARQIIIFGPKDRREIVKELVKELIVEIGIPSGLFETRVFQLKYADADKVKENLEGIYEQQARYSSSSGGYSRRPRNVETSETVKVIAFPTTHQVIVITSPENMLEVAEQIAEWDVPLDLEQIRPRIITLKNSDPAQMADLLNTLFSDQSGSSGDLMAHFFDDDMEEKEKIAGPLHEQLTFEEVPGTKKIIVISNFPEAYDVVERLILELDKQKMVGEDVKQVREWIEQRGHEPGRTALPVGWSLDYDDGRLPGGAGHWPAGMAKDLASLKIMLKPYDPSEASLQGEKYEFDILSMESEKMGYVRIEPESDRRLRLPNYQVLKPGRYLLKYERRYGTNEDNFRIECGAYPVDVSKPGMYELRFTPKVGTAEIAGTLGGCYAVNFERVGSVPRVRGYAYQNAKEQYRLDGLPPGKYLLSAVGQQQSGNVLVDRAEVTVAAGEKATVNMVRPAKGSCSLKGSILGRTRKGTWYVLIREPGTGEMKEAYTAYEARTMDSLYVLRGRSITQETEDRARYKIENVAPGSYTVTVIQHPPLMGVLRQQSKPLTLRAGEDAVLDFDLQIIPEHNYGPGVKTDSEKAARLIEVMGIVKDPQGQPVSGTSITLFQTKLEYVTNAEGKFAASLAPSDKMRYFFAVHKQRKLVASGRLAGGKLNVEIDLIPARIVSGRVLAPNGRPVSGAQVAPLPMTCFHVLTDSEGRFDVGWSPEWAGDLEEFCLTARHQERNLAGVVEITESTRTANIELEPALALTGTVEDPNGTPIPEARVSISLIRGRWGAGTPVEGVVTDDQGRFELSALPQRQEYGVGAKAEGYWRNGIATGVINRVTQVEEVGSIILKKPILSVSGIAVDGSGKPVANVPVYFRGKGQPRLDAQTDAQGRFSFKKVCTGPVQINAKNETLFGIVETQGGAKDVRLVVGPRFEPMPDNPTSATQKTRPEQGSAEAGTEIGAAIEGEEKSNEAGKVILTLVDPNSRPVVGA